MVMRFFNLVSRDIHDLQNQISFGAPVKSQNLHTQAQSVQNFGKDYFRYFVSTLNMCHHLVCVVCVCGLGDVENLSLKIFFLPLASSYLKRTSN